MKAIEGNIHDHVRQAYGGRARRKLAMDSDPASKCGCAISSSCCASIGVEPAMTGDYSPEALATLPEQVRESTWGCGDPVTIAHLRPGQVVLDLGSGGGLDCLLAAEHVGPSGRVIGIDMTPEMLSLAWRNVASAGATNVEFRYGKIEELPVDSTSVDVVISNCVINLSPDKSAVFREIARVLKPGGKVSVSDLVLQGELPSELRNDAHLWEACVAGAMLEQDYLQAMRDAGLDEVQVASRVLVPLESFTDNVLVQQRLEGLVASVRVLAVKPA